MLITKDNLEAMYWVAILRQANPGNKEAQETLQVENELRAQNNQPTVQEEFMTIVEESEARAKIEQAKAKKMRQR